MKEKLTIVKVGGAVVEDEAQLSQLLKDFSAITGKKVLVHGGGRKATKVAEALGISFQAVSSWERDEYRPDTDNLIKLAELFDVSVSVLVEEKHQLFKTKEAIYNWEHMKTYVKTTAKNFRPSTGTHSKTWRVSRNKVCETPSCATASLPLRLRAK